MSQHTQTPGTPVTQEPWTHEHDVEASAPGAVSRRHFLTSATAGLMAGAVAGGGLTGTALAAHDPGHNQEWGGRRGHRTLLKGGVVLSLDSSIGDFEQADVLIEGSKIVEVRLNIQAETAVIDASNMIVMPGFVDTHRHIWEGSLRSILPNGLLSDYLRDITGSARAVYRPEDNYAMIACRAERPVG